MAYALAQFTKDCRDRLASGSNEDTHEEVRHDLERLLADPEFVAEHCGPDAEPGIRTVYHDARTGFQVLVHVYETGKAGPPHDHGDHDGSWAVYGQAVLHTDMTMWRRTDDGSRDGHAEIEPTGTDFDRIPTCRFDPDRRTVEIGSRLAPLPS